MMQHGTRPLVMIALPTDKVFNRLRQQDPSMNLTMVQFQNFWSCEIVHSSSRDVWRDVEVLFCGANSLHYLLPFLPKLKWIQGVEAGTDVVSTLAKEGKIPADVTVTRNGGTFKRPVSQYVIGQMISEMFRLPKHMRNQEQRKWDISAEATSNTKLSSCTVSILGLGIIGTEIARACKFWGMTVWGLTRSKVTEERRKEYADQIRQSNDIKELLTQCDFLVNILPSTAETRGLLNGDLLSHCTRRPIFINVGRGDIIDEDSVITALRSGWLSGAVLDTFIVEPLPESSPLWKEKGVVITPHIAHGIYNVEAFDQDKNNPNNMNADMFMSYVALIGSSSKHEEACSTIWNVLTEILPTEALNPVDLIYGVGNECQS